MLTGLQSQHDCAFGQFVLAYTAKSIGIAAAEAEDEDLVLKIRASKVLQDWCEEHGFIVWMSDEETDSFAFEGGKGLGHVDCEEPEDDEKDGNLGGSEPMHGGEWSIPIAEVLDNVIAGMSILDVMRTSGVVEVDAQCSESGTEIEASGPEERKRNRLRHAGQQKLQQSNAGTIKQVQEWTLMCKRHYHEISSSALHATY